MTKKTTAPIKATKAPTRDPKADAKKAETKALVKVKLLEMKAQSESSIAGLMISAKELEEAAQDMDSFDISSNNSEMNRLKNLRDREAKVLEQVGASLSRIDTSKFGICLICGDNIPEMRLIKSPLTFRCVDCQADQELDQKRHKFGGKAVVQDDDSLDD